MDAQRFDPTKKMGLSPLVIPQACEVGLSPGDQQVASPKPGTGANDEEPQYAFLNVPPYTPRAARRQKSCDVERLRYSKSKSAAASPITSPVVAFPTSNVARFPTTKDSTLLDSVAFKFPSPRAEGEYYSTDSDRSQSSSGYETSSGSELCSPTDDHVDRRIVRPQRSRLGLRKSFANLRKARSSANLRKLPCTATFGVPTPVSSDGSLASLPSPTSPRSGVPPPSRRPSIATGTLSSPAALNEVTDTLRKLASRLNLRDRDAERKWNFDEAVDYYERAWARAESGGGAIEVCVEQTQETFAEPRRSPRGVQDRPDGIGLYVRPRSRKNTMPAVAERRREEVWL